MKEEWRYREYVKLDGELTLDEWNLLLRLIYGKEKWEDWKGEVETIMDSIDTQLVIKEGIL